MRTVCLLLWLFSGILIKAQKTDAEMDQWMSRFSTAIGGLQVTVDQRFASVTKYYRKNSDTILIFDTKSEKKIVDTLLKKSKVTFLNNTLLFAVGNNTAELIELPSKKSKKFDQIISGEILSVSKQVVLLDYAKSINIYDYKGKLLHSSKGVQDLISDGDGRVYLVYKNGSTSEIAVWNGKTVKTIHTTSNGIKSIKYLPSKKFISLTEEYRKADDLELSISLIRTSDNYFFKKKEISSGGFESVKISEVHDSDKFLIDFQHIQQPQKDKMVEVWYSGDKRLRDKKDGTKHHRYLHWNISKDEIIEIPADRFSDYIGMNDARYLWAYHTDEEFTYTGYRSFNVFRYDTHSDKAERIFDNVEELVMSENRRFTLAYRIDKKMWILYDHFLNKTKDIETTEKLSNPVMMSDQAALFECADGLFRYDLIKGSSKKIIVSKNSKVTFHNLLGNMIYHLSNFKFVERSADATKPLILQVKRTDHNDNGYFTFLNGMIKNIIPYAPNRIKDFKYYKKKNKIFTVEENFNVPASLYLSEKGDPEKKLLYRTNLHDQKAKLIKQDILSYKNSAGTSLKGILTYPVDFDPSKKYPVVVYIYSLLSGSADKYIYPDWGNTGFNKRILLENGYFVFQPDIVYDKRGTGISALDCVNSGLDEIVNHRNVDASRLGLTGHSLGGYETNFIATHSKRFAAYVSGSSLGDIPHFYFSFSDFFNVANYMRFENGQFEMAFPYAANKDLYFHNNPINYVENVSAPVLIWAGKKDTNTPLDQPMSFFMGLLRNDKMAVALLYDKQEHSLKDDSEEIKDLNNKVMDWWNYFLKKEENIDWISQEMKRDAQ
ncbi:Prolyl tripeptidyl peptidase precursor [Chryseobacterium sp. MOF25P]|uniref:alpha/beta hydrolase family protein n=1 Tax=unclassified Chryseobacterium TaxID=2593645 RepID=UPI000804D79E|nr:MULTISPECIES: prolyl oligopeptidase family serine peptidase [unclassified Chryseobacterium]OBW43557.1 Prolyl tripeptidyl peptidase precursor [Chryseobacterium sp. MOF25P]OBW46669.1 Prolyl tripeptidyl peptidase precursor [Chryseobacterium sp. BGARF1]